MKELNPSDFIRYLEAKKGIDDRALNHHVWATLEQRVRQLQQAREIAVVEVGCGIGTMIERALETRLLTKAIYTAIDLQPEYVVEVKTRVSRYANRGGFQVVKESPGTLFLEKPGQRLSLKLVASDVMDYMRGGKVSHRFDLLIAHAFLDLVDLSLVVPRFLDALKPGGLIYATINFDGLTIFEPVLNPELDRQIVRLYHQTMDHRRVDGKPSGSSVTGRLLPGMLRESGVEILAAGSSDWVSVPSRSGYDKHEAYFLHCMIDSIGNVLKNHPDIVGDHLSWWVDQRHEQIEESGLLFVAHQIDILGQVEVNP